MSAADRQGADRYEEDKHVFMTMLKGFEADTGVRMLTRTEFRGLDVRQRWVCASHPYKHPQFWTTPQDIQDHAERGESGCPVCRELAVQETVSFKDLNDGAMEQEARSDKSLQRSLTKMRQKGQVTRYAT